MEKHRRVLELTSLESTVDIRIHVDQLQQVMVDSSTVTYIQLAHTILLMNGLKTTLGRTMVLFEDLCN